MNKNFTIKISARTTTSTSTQYRPFSEYGFIETTSEIESGSGEAKDPYIVRIGFKNKSLDEWKGVIKIEAELEAGETPFFVMPGYMYGDNTAFLPSSGRKEFPRLKVNPSKRPESSYFMTRSDRLALPVSAMYAGKRVLAISYAPYSCDEGEKIKFNGFTCDILNKTVGFTLGYENAPWLFVQTATVREREGLSDKNSFAILAEESFYITLRIYSYQADNINKIYDCIEDVYYRYHKAPRKLENMTVSKATKMLSGALADYAWLPEDHMYSGFVYDREGGFEYNKLGSLSWTNGLSVAVPMLLAGIRLKDDRIRAQALDCIDYFVNSSLNESSGLLYDAVSDGKWSVRGWWYDGMHTPGHSGYLLGQALYYILKAYDYEKEYLKINHNKWFELVSKVLDRLNREMNSDYEYPFSLSEKTGAGLEYMSLGSCWALAATLYYIYLSRDSSYLNKAKLSEAHYYKEYVSRLECYGGPLDTDKANDDEGILAYIRVCRLLHQITGEKVYLDHLRIAINYELTFKLCYNTPVEVNPLKDIGWSSCGGSITSVANPHIHPMSSTVVDDMIYYVSKTEDAYIKSRIEDTLLWGMQTFNTYDKEYGYGRIGWMSERFCFCEGLLTEHYPDGSLASTWFALMAWASASIIEGFVGMAWEE